MTALVACDKDDNKQETVTSERTVLIYMAANNNLSQWSTTNHYYADEDLAQVKQGVKTMGNNSLAVFVNQAKTNRSDGKPYLLYFRNGERTDSIPMEEGLTSDPALFESIVRKAFADNPANSYGLVLWGHATGWNINSDSVAYNSWARRRAYGGDTGNESHSSPGNYWMNIPSMAQALKHVPHLDFIFCDCCHMACIENAYELRNVTDYLIGSPAEIPGEGAPYHTVIPAMMEKTTFYSSIIDRYYEQRSSNLDVPLAAIKTSEMTNLASATRTVMNSFVDQLGGSDYPDLSGLIHYYNDQKYDNEFYDMNDFILRFATSDNYNVWKQAFDRAVVYKKMATRWMTNRDPFIQTSVWNRYYGDFEMTEARFGGVSMFIPQWRFQTTENVTIRQMGWYYAAGYSDIGW